MASILLKEAGPSKVRVIKIVREATGLGLAEAKEVVDAVDAGEPFEMVISAENVNDILDELLTAGAVATIDREERYAKHKNPENLEKPQVFKKETSSVGTMGREETMQTLYEVGQIAETFEILSSEGMELRKRIRVEKDRAEELRNAVSGRAKAIKWTAIICSLITWLFFFLFGIVVTIFVWVIMNKTVIKKDRIKHEAENNENANKHLETVVAPLEAELENISLQLEELRTSGKIVWAKDIVGEEMFYSECIGDLYDLIKNRRADNLKEALNLYDDNQYKARMEARQAAIQNATEIQAVEAVKQTAYLEETAKNTHQSATAAKATAYHTRQVARNTRRFR